MSSSDAWDSTLTGRAPAETALAQTLIGEQEAGDAANRAEPGVTGADRYELGVEIGRGGMGRVVAAHDRQFGREVAIKQLLAASDDAARERFGVEALITGNLEHPGIPAVYERGDGDGAPFYAMRRVRGRTLTDALRAARTQDERLRLVSVVVHAAQTVGFAHANGVVHRDIKPDNILIGKHGETFVLDWGIAKVHGVPTTAGGGEAASASASSSVKTQHGSVIGTPAYMSPEQAEGKLELIDERTDVFALGALLYHVLSGRAPYVGKDVNDVLDRVRRCEHEPLAKTAPKAPPALRAICERAMARDPNDRFGSAAELSRAIEDYTAEAMAGRPNKTVRWSVNAISALLVVGLIAGVFTMWSGFSSFRAQGHGAYALVVLTVLGSGLAILEFATRGRYKLSALILAVAALTFLSGVLNFVNGMDNVIEASLARPDEPIMRIGTREAIGTIGAACGFTGLQIMLWSVARRRAQLAD